jgi:MFS-type transporter involved in bile tolerance (Atg22 family)
MSIKSGAYVCLCSVVLVDLFGVQKVSNAFGILSLFEGIASIIGPPLIGIIIQFYL